MSLGLAVIALVIAQRLSELVIAQRNTKALLARGAYEVGAAHYPLIVLLHASWLASLIWLAWDRPVNLWFLALYLALQLFRIWVLASMGRRWTTRIIVVPGEQLVRRGPYRFMPHPNYALVAAEIAALPMVFGLWRHALLFSVLNACMLAWRIHVEASALKHAAAAKP